MVLAPCRRSNNSNYDGIDDGSFLDDLTYLLSLDIDPSQGTNFFSFDPINGIAPPLSSACWDHGMSTNDTSTKTNVSVASCLSTDTAIASAAATTYANNLASLNVAQNSWQPAWFFASFDPTLDATYDIRLAAFSQQREIARTSIQIIVGAGGAATADVAAPSTLLSLSLGLLGLGATRAQRRKQG